MGEVRRVVFGLGEVRESLEDDLSRSEVVQVGNRGGGKSNFILPPVPLPPLLAPRLSPMVGLSLSLWLEDIIGNESFRIGVGTCAGGP